MKRLNNTILKGCAYSVLILSLFYMFAALFETTSSEIAPGRFALICTFGMIISAAELMYEELKINKVFKCILHYFVLMIAFTSIFIVSGSIVARGTSRVFVAIVLYTVFYFIVWTIVHFLRKLIDKADKKLDAKSAKNAKRNSQGTYKSLYSEGKK